MKLAVAAIPAPKKKAANLLGKMVGDAKLDFSSDKLDKKMICFVPKRVPDDVFPLDLHKPFYVKVIQGFNRDGRVKLLRAGLPWLLRLEDFFSEVGRARHLNISKKMIHPAEKHFECDVEVEYHRRDYEAVHAERI